MMRKALTPQTPDQQVLPPPPPPEREDSVARTPTDTHTHTKVNYIGLKRAVTLHGYSATRSNCVTLYLAVDRRTKTGGGGGMYYTVLTELSKQCASTIH